MRVTFDRSVNAAYIYLEKSDESKSARQHVVDEPHTRGMIVLDFDEEGRLIGIEVLNATQTLPEGVLDDAERT